MGLLSGPFLDMLIAPDIVPTFLEFLPKAELDLDFGLEILFSLRNIVARRSPTPKVHDEKDSYRKHNDAHKLHP